MYDGLHLVTVPDSDSVPELVLNHDQVVQVVTDVRWKALFISEPYDALSDLIRESPEDLQGDLVGFHQNPFAGVLPV